MPYTLHIFLIYVAHAQGKCYDSFWDRHGIAGECTVVAKNFTELLWQLFNSQGKSLFWLNSDFVYIGDAYD